MNIPHHRRQEATIWACAILIPVLVVIYTFTGAASASAPSSCLTPDQICDAYSSPTHTPWDTVEGYIPCLQGCLDEFWKCDEWSDGDVSSCITCCYDFYFPRFPI